MLPLNAASPNRWCLTTYSTLWTYINSNKQLQTWLNFISIYRVCSLAIWQILCELVRSHWTHLATDKVNCAWHIVHPSAKLSAITWTSMILPPSMGRGFAAKCRWLWWHPVTVRLPHNFIIIDTYSSFLSSHLLTFAEEFAFFYFWKPLSVTQCATGGCTSYKGVVNCFIVPPMHTTSVGGCRKIPL